MVRSSREGNERVAGNGDINIEQMMILVKDQRTHIAIGTASKAILLPLFIHTLPMKRMENMKETGYSSEVTHVFQIVP